MAPYSQPSPLATYNHRGRAVPGIAMNGLAAHEKATDELYEGDDP
jgi:hypothetical protein